MFEADYKDVELTKARKFGDIGESDTIRVFEVAGIKLARSFKSMQEKEDYVYSLTAKNSFILRDEIVHKIADKDNIFNYISCAETELLVEAFVKLNTSLPRKTESEDDSPQ